jgi:phosphate transport system permease protein
MAADVGAMPGSRRRRGIQVGFRVGTFLALLLVIAPAAWLVISVVAKAAPHWQWSVLWTQGTGTGGGLLQAIIGTLILMVGVFIIAGSIGVLAGIHLAELARPRRNGKPSGGFLRTASDVLSGFPSIVLGYCGYVALVVGLHWGFSLLPALIILSIMVIPYIAKSTESAINQVPVNYREGADALGMSMGYSLRKVILKTALPGIVTGLLLALAIASGETAPLIYTAGWTTQIPSLQLTNTHGFPYLTYPVFNFYDQANNQAHYLAFDAALLLVVLIAILLIASRIIVARTQRNAEGRRR